MSSSAEPDAGLARAFIERLLEAGQELPAAVAHETRRALLNVVGTAVGASQTAAVDAVVFAGRRKGGRVSAVPPGRTERLDRYWAAAAAGLAAHLDDFGAARARAWAASLGSPAEATILGKPERMSAAWSAFINVIACGWGGPVAACR